VSDPTRQPGLDRLLARLSSLISAATDTLESDPALIDDWYDEIARQLRRYTLAAYMTGNGGAAPTPAADKLIAGAIKAQLEYLSAFRDEIKAADEWKPAWGPRAQMYGQSIKAAYWNGRTRGYPLPAMPGDGTTICLTNCGCAWDIDELEGDGNADAYWRRAKDDSCQSCLEREAQWSPLQIREGVLV
jgi:hypothetical protein